VVEEVTSRAKLSRRKSNTHTQKVLESHFKNQKLAKLAKQCTRMATCVVNLCPEDSLFCWPIFEDEVKRFEEEGRAKGFLESLAEINGNPDARDQLLRLVNVLARQTYLFTDTYFPDGIWCMCHPS
jgi:hypothetical protein